jgi:hypothetical protein
MSRHPRGVVLGGFYDATAGMQTGDENVTKSFARKQIQLFAGFFCGENS